jgi:hypothetical protein
MRKSARSALAGLFESGLLIAMATAATGAQAAAAPGTLDPSFGAGGKVLTNLNLPAGTGTLTLVTDVAVQPGGDIVVAGSFGLVRYLPGGKLDTSFGTSGVARTGFAVAALAIQPNGEYVVAGQKETGPELRFRRAASPPPVSPLPGSPARRSATTAPPPPPAGTPPTPSPSPRPDRSSSPDGSSRRRGRSASASNGSTPTGRPTRVSATAAA